ncbi:hypothetical protein ACFQQB_64745 [Nonomuraea rubra]|uniref:hypothetical protein n=1 Tax=Nonomuraea rubra TaxID=46180 RepID=UPI003607996E
MDPLVAVLRLEEPDQLVGVHQATAFHRAEHADVDARQQGTSRVGVAQLGSQLRRSNQHSGTPLRIVDQPGRLP